MSDLNEAWDRLANNPFGYWSDVRSRLQDICKPNISPSFQVPPGSSIFTIGSCFARNIETHLHDFGFDTPTMHFNLPVSERSGGRAAGFLNKYTPPAIYQELKWTADILDRDGIVTEDDCRTISYPMGDLWLDNNANSRKPVTWDRLVERRAELFALFRQAFDANCVVLTLGFTECFYDTERDLYVNNNVIADPDLRAQLADTVIFKPLDYPTTHRFLHDSITLMKQRNPGVAILLTVSPVPIAATFTDQDVVLAYMATKSQLRAAVDSLTAEFDRLDYFPGFEQVMLTRDWNVFQPDMRHVSDHVVQGIVQDLSQSYFPVDPALLEKKAQETQSQANAQSAFNDGYIRAQRLATEGGEAEAIVAALAAAQVAEHVEALSGSVIKALRLAENLQGKQSDWIAQAETQARIQKLSGGNDLRVRARMIRNLVKRGDLAAAQADFSVLSGAEGVHRDLTPEQMNSLENAILRAVKRAGRKDG